MNHQMLAACGAVALGTSLVAAFAQPVGNAPTAQTPTTAPLRYTSAFTDYKPWQAVPADDWRRVNDRVGAATAAARDGAPDAAAAMPMPMPMPAAKPQSATPSPAATAPPMNHRGHAGHGGKP